MAEKVLRTILDEKIIAIIRNVNSKQIDRVVEALLDGHIRCMEFAFSGGKDYNEDEILYLINRIRDKYADEVIVGAGTVMTIDLVERACNMGAQYMISPNVNKEVISKTKEMGCVSIPGAFTPTEITKAYEYGADIVKIFPCNIAKNYLRDVSVPLYMIPMMAVGGINQNNIYDILHSGAVAVGVGGNLVSIDLIQEGKYSELTARARELYNEANR